MPIPAEIVGLLRAKITLNWVDGHTTAYNARDLRLACRCAECIEETSGKQLIDPASVSTNIRAKRIELVGQYAMLIEWSDGHSTGIFNFRDLRRNCPCPSCESERSAGGVPGG
jgi:ATP-binding protein involved in chromosome partitioning